MRRLCTLVFGAILILSGTARADALPPLTDAERAAIASGVDASGAADDPGFDALVAHVKSWGNLMRVWSAGQGRPDESVQLAWLEGLVRGDADAEIGTDAILRGKLIERSPAPKRANVEKWVIEPLSDSSTESATRAIILYVVRPASVLLEDPAPGWFVRAGARYAGLAEFIPRDAPPGSAPRRYPVFVGATYEVTPRAGAAPSGLFGWIGLVVAVMLGVLITLAWIVQKSRVRGVSALRNRGPASSRESSP